MARAGTGQTGAAATYLAGVVAGVLGIEIGPRPVNGAGKGAAVKANTRTIVETATAI